MTVTYWEVALAFVMVVIWAVSISFMIRTLDASQEKKNRVTMALSKILLPKFYIGGLKRTVNEKHAEKVQREAKAAGIAAVVSSAAALFSLGLGIYSLSWEDKFPSFMYLVFAGPLLALISLYQAFLLKLLSSEKTKLNSMGEG